MLIKIGLYSLGFIGLKNICYIVYFVFPLRYIMLRNFTQFIILLFFMVINLSSFKSKSMLVTTTIMQHETQSSFFLDTWIGSQSYKVPPPAALLNQHYLHSDIVQPKSEKNDVTSQHLCSAAVCSARKKVIYYLSHQRKKVIKKNSMTTPIVKKSVLIAKPCWRISTQIIFNNSNATKQTLSCLEVKDQKNICFSLHKLSSGIEIYIMQL